MKRFLIALMMLFGMLTACVNLSQDVPLIYDKPVVRSFAATPAAITQGAASTLTWNVSGATAVTIDHGVGSVALSGSTSVVPQGTTTYILTAINSWGTATATTQIAVAGSVPSVPQLQIEKPVINYFKANPAIFIAGSPIIISWSVRGATDIKIVPEVAPTDPEVYVTLYPPASTTYTLTASNAAGSVTQAITVNMTGTVPLQPQGEKTALLNLVLAESGSLVKNATTYARSTAVCVGDDAQNLANRAFLSFDLTSIPPTANISEAVLILTGYTATGNPTYSSASWGNMGALEVYQYQYGSSSELGRINYEAMKPLVGSLKLMELTGTPLKLDVTLDSNGNNVVQQLMNNAQGRCQFRAQFFTSTNWDSKADQLCMDGAVLQVKYTMP